MTDQLPAIVYPRHPAHIDAYIEVLGPPLAVRFLIEFGGAPAYFPNEPKGRGEMENMIGADKLRELGQRMRDNRVELPMPKSWLILALHAEGKTVATICRTLKTSSTNVKRRIREANLR